MGHNDLTAPALLTPAEAEQLRGLYGQDRRFRSTITMSRHRFGEGEYRYFATPYPEPVERLKQALYPRLLPIARDWWARLGRPAPWQRLRNRMYSVERTEAI